MNEADVKFVGSGNAFYATVPALAGQTNSIVAAIRDAAGNTSYVTKEYWIDFTTESTEETQSFAYNAAGCCTNLNGISLKWDERYRLTAAVRDSLFNIQYSYDVLGRRVSRSFVDATSPSQTNTEHYVYNDNQIVADLDAAGNLLRITVYQSDGDVASTNTYYAIKDHQNSVLAFVNESGM